MIVQDRHSTSIMQRLDGLKDQGFRLSFRRDATCIYSTGSNEPLYPDEFSIEETYYLEDVANPDAERIIYAISLVDGRRGYLVDPCNVYSDNISYEMEQKLQWQYPIIL